jgi:coenzyme F420 hydrogenase subunit beta
MCVDVCPSHIIFRHRTSDRDFDNIQGSWLGKIGYIQLAFSASSGGVTRTIIKNAVENSFCDRAYCLFKSDSYPWAVGDYKEGFVDALTIANSMYLPILANRNLKNPISPGKTLVVGTNCQLLGAERFYRKKKEKLIKISLLCKQQKTYDFTKHVAKRLNININKGDPVIYRGGGWPGTIKIGEKLLSWADAASFPYDKRLWSIPGCRFCGHLLGANADVTVADPWGIENQRDPGKTMIIARTKQGVSLINQCSKKIDLESINIETVIKSIGWKIYKKKLRQIDYEIGLDRSIRSHVLSKISQYQRRILEYTLLHVNFPSLFLKILKKFPIADELF